jgi:hypothetical protein
LNSYLSTICKSQEFTNILSGIERDKAQEVILGLSGTAKSYLVAALYRSTTTRPFILITYNPQRAEKLEQDLATFLSPDEVMVFPHPEIWPHEDASESVDVLSQRIAVMSALARRVRKIFIVPDWVITPVGGGGILSQCWKGFNEYKQLGLIDSLPKMAGVQPAGCAPLIKAFDDKCKPDEIKVWEGKPESIAVTIADVFPIDGEAALSAIYESGGVAEKTTDEEIIEAMRLMAQNEGVFAEPAGAAPLAAVKKLRDKGIIGSDETVVVVATGHGLKDLNAVVSNVKRPPILESEEELPLIVKRYLG